MRYTDANFLVLIRSDASKIKYEQYCIYSVILQYFL